MTIFDLLQAIKGDVQKELNKIVQRTTAEVAEK